MYIQDCLARSFEYLHIYQKSRKKLVILKLDFEKDLDIIEHWAMLNIMEKKSSGAKWIAWMKLSFSTGTSLVLLNGSLAKVFHCGRVVRQGYPLSPLLFVLAVDLLQSIINRAKDQGLLNLPLALHNSSDFPILQYADNTLIFMEGCGRQLFS